MTTSINPLQRLFAERGAVLTASGLYINLFEIRFVEVATWEIWLISLLAGLAFLWGYQGIDESDYTHSALVKHRVLLPGYRAGTDAFKQLAERIPSLDYLVKFFEENRSRRQALRLVDDFVTIAFDELAMDESLRPSVDEIDQMADTISTDTTLLRRDGYRLLAKSVFANEPDEQRYIRLILVLCREYIKADDTIETGETIHDLQSGISRALSASGCDFEAWNDKAENLLAAYGTAYDAIHHDEPLSSDPLDETSAEPPKEYYDDFLEYFLPFRDRNALSEELVATIIDVVDRGELDQSAVARDVEQKIQIERKRVRDELNIRDAYLLLSLDAGLSKSSSGNARESVYNRFPDHIQFGRTMNKNDVSALPEEIYLTTDVIFTNRDYEGPNDFLEDVTELIPDDELAGGLVSAYELRVANPAYEPSKEAARKHLPQGTRDSVNAIEFLETGDSSRAVTEEAIDNLLGKKIRVRDLLSAIPVNVFVDAPPNQREVVDAAYEDIEEELGVGELYDWGNFDVDDIAPLLIETDTDRNSERVATDEGWEEIAEQMIESARECERAARS
jgi:hypothetical protein